MFPKRRYRQKRKLNNTSIVVDGIEFDSKKEAKRYTELELLERAGEITDLELQKRYELIPAQRDGSGKLIEREVSYIADFAYLTKNGDKIVEDVKGYKRGAAYQLFTIKRKLMLYKFGIKVKET